MLCYCVLVDRCHNHVNTETLYTALQQCKELLSESVLSMLDAFDRIHRNEANCQQCCRHDCHGSLEQRLKDVVSECASAEGNECVFLRRWIRLSNCASDEGPADIFGRWGEPFPGLTTAVTSDSTSWQRAWCVCARLLMPEPAEGVSTCRSSVVQEEEPVVGILLCQFHAQRYVKRMVEPKFRDEIEGLFEHMVYVPTKEQFQSRLEYFERRIKKVAPPFAKYFERN
ncbi:hypothetical protein GQ600_22820 [Phytophthora cactorum]|nr:hypothetical protein GQ600_22820 [Phytophthora cactorum]